MKSSADQLTPPAPWNAAWKSPGLAKSLDHAAKTAIMPAFLTLAATSALTAASAIALPFFSWVAGAAAFAINAVIALAPVSTRFKFFKIVLVVGLATAFGFGGGNSWLVLVDGAETYTLSGGLASTVWLLAWSLVTVAVLMCIARSVIWVVGVILACLVAAVLMGDVHIYRVAAACVFWNLILGITFFVWGTYNRAWNMPRVRSMPDRCPVCGYSRTGLTSPICPECGVSVHATESYSQTTTP